MDADYQRTGKVHVEPPPQARLEVAERLGNREIDDA
jgi:hypothetical protein